MKHFVMDAFSSYRSRLDDIQLVHEILEEIPLKMGIKTVMPPFVMPYYNGEVAEDCGISGFVFLAGGHFTIHTFSYRESYFVDLVYPEAFNSDALQSLIKNAFPAEKVDTFSVERNKPGSFPLDYPMNAETDFGPHLFLDFKNYEGPKTLDDLFHIFDTLPYEIGMTPIIRPYSIHNRYGEEKVTSIITMIAESHISLHYFHDSKEAYLDLFSCKFFDYSCVVEKLKQVFPGTLGSEMLLPRGSKYQSLRNVLEQQSVKSKSWLKNI